MAGSRAAARPISSPKPQLRFLQARFGYKSRCKTSESIGQRCLQELILDTFGDTILLRAADSTAVELYSEERIREFAADEVEVGRMLSATRKPPDR
jgi:hypothetical protein